MTEQEEIRRRLDACKYLYMVDFGRGEYELDLVVNVIEARSGSTLSTISTGSEVVDKVLGQAYPIVSGPGCARFTLTFESYVAFAVMNESYVLPARNEDYSKKLRTYETSAFLDYIAEATCASADYPGPFKHFAIVCLNHVIEVACASEPTIEIHEG